MRDGEFAPLYILKLETLRLCVCLCDPSVHFFFANFLYNKEDTVMFKPQHMHIHTREREFEKKNERSRVIAAKMFIHSPKLFFFSFFFLT